MANWHTCSIVAFVTIECHPYILSNVHYEYTYRKTRNTTVLCLHYISLKLNILNTDTFINIVTSANLAHTYTCTHSHMHTNTHCPGAH